MNITLNFTPFRRMIRPLSLYSEKTRSDDLDAKIKWVISEDIQIYGYHQPDYQTRLTNVRLNKKAVPELSDEYPDFRTEVPTTRGMRTATGGDEIVIEIEPGQDDLTIHTDDFRYDIEKSWGTRDLHIEKRLLPMKQIKVKGSISKDKLQNYVHFAPSSPLRLIVGNDVVKLVSNTDQVKASLDISKHVTILSNNETGEYLYNVQLLSEILRKLPGNEQIELFVNNDLIRLRYEIGDNIGHINYYQQGKVNTSRTSVY
jgi:hypothetical protein